MRMLLFLISLALSSAGCSPTRENGNQSLAEVDPDSRALATATANVEEQDAVRAVAFEDDAEDRGGKREFSYSWPAAVSAVEPLAERLRSERDEALTEQKAEWQDALINSPQDCVSCRSRGYEKEWKVVAELDGWLSLSADFYTYSGGAHGIYGKQSLVWDKRSETAIDGAEIFKSAVALENALGAGLCRELNRARERKRGVAVDPQGGSTFNDCPGMDEASVLIGSSTGEYFDRIGVYFGPYVAGPYAEGDYELDFPVTTSIIDAVKPEYVSAFRVKR